MIIRPPPDLDVARAARGLPRLGRLALLVLATSVAGARAEDIASRPDLFGDWGGLRTRWADAGVTLELGYGSEIAHNFSGGSKALTRYTDQWVLGATGDTDKLWGWKGGTLQATYTERGGRDLGADANLGTSMLVQEVYGRSQTVHLTQFWLDQRWFDDRVGIKLGRLTVGEDFASSSCDFQNLTFCGAQPGNIVGDYWVNWPTSQWAMRVKVQAPGQTSVQLGVYQVDPRYLQDDYARHSGWRLENPKGTTGALIPLELGWRPELDGMPGSYKVGGWYDTADGDDLADDVDGNPRGITGLAPRRRDGEYGGYVSLQQQVTGRADGPGLTLFLNASQADRATAALDRQIAAGLMFQGPFERARDAIGLAVGATHSNPRFADFVRQNNARTGQRVLAGKGNEVVVELYYSWVPIRSVYVRPNLQVVVHPGGTSDNSNAFLVGLKSGVSF